MHPFLTRVMFSRSAQRSAHRRRGIVSAGVMAAGLTITGIAAHPASADEVTSPTPPVTETGAIDVRTGHVGEPDGASAPRPGTGVELEVPAVRSGRAGDRHGLLPTPSEAPTGGTPAAAPSSPRHHSTAPSVSDAPTIATSDTDAPRPANVPVDRPATGGTGAGNLATAPPPVVSSAPLTPASPIGPTTNDAPATSRTIVTGDNLWDLAATHLARGRGQDVSTLDAGDVAAYWVRVCEANRGQLQSRDPGLIYPGEQVQLPAT